MKKIILTFALAALAVGAWAQDTPKKPSIAGFVTNGFWDNWEVSGGFGGGMLMSNGKNLGSFGDRLSITGDFSLTKWVHPVVGLRLQLQGGRFTNFDPDLGKVKWPYLFVHTDLMINFSNWAGGYREDRAYYLVPFVGFGYMATNFTDESQRNNFDGTHQSLAFSYGLLNKFRLSRSVDFNIEFKGLLAPSRVVPAKLAGSYAFGFTATAGFTYRFNQRGWQRGVAGYTPEDIMAMQDAVAASMLSLEASMAENAALAGELENAQAEAAAANAAAAKANAAAAAAKNAAKKAEMGLTGAAESIILFDINMSKLTQQEKTRLQLVADWIKAGPKDKVYTIQGHADHQTGTPAYNETLSVSRAKRVYEYLIGQGVDKKQLSYEGFGGKDNPYPKVQKANRSAVLK